MEIFAALLGFLLSVIIHQIFQKWISFRNCLSTWYGRASQQRITCFLPENEIYEWAKKVGGNNVVMRQLQPTCYKLRKFDKKTPLNHRTLTATMRCYGCSFPCHKNHPVYVFSCYPCGTKFQTNRHLTRDLQGLTAVVIGCRTKLGHQTVVKLLEAGATVIGTTRYPQRALELYEPYPEWKEWKDRFLLYPLPFDLDVKVIADLGAALSHWIPGGKVDILVCCAGQTIRVREKTTNFAKPSCGFNRYGDAKFVAATMVNSWQMTVEDLVQQEMEEVFRVNAIAPCLIYQQLLPN